VRSHRRLIALLLLGGVAIGLAVWARQTLGPDRYRTYTRPQLEAVLARRPNDAAALHRLGLLYVEERRFTEARRTLERAYQAAPGSARIANALGEACAHQHDFPAARAYFQQATQLDPALAVAHRNLGDMWGVAGDFVQGANIHLLQVFDEELAALDLLILGVGFCVDDGDILTGARRRRGRGGGRWGWFGLAGCDGSGDGRFIGAVVGGRRGLVLLTPRTG